MFVCVCSVLAAKLLVCNFHTSQRNRHQRSYCELLVFGFGAASARLPGVLQLATLHVKAGMPGLLA